MNVTLTPELEQRVQKLVERGDFPTPDSLIQQAVARFIDDQLVAEARLLQRVDAGEPLPMDQCLEERLEALLCQADESGEPVEMTHQDWEDIRREGLALIKARKSA